MKKLICLTLVGMLALALIACEPKGSENGLETDPSKDTVVTDPADTTGGTNGGTVGGEVTTPSTDSDTDENSGWTGIY